MLLFVKVNYSYTVLHTCIVHLVTIVYQADVSSTCIGIVLASVLKIEEVVNNSRERITATQHCIVLETPQPIATSIRMSILQHQRVNNNK